MFALLWYGARSNFFFLFFYAIPISFICSSFQPPGNCPRRSVPRLNLTMLNLFSFIYDVTCFCSGLSKLSLAVDFKFRPS